MNAHLIRAHRGTLISNHRICSRRHIDLRDTAQNVTGSMFDVLEFVRCRSK